MRLLIAGSRTITDYAVVEEAVARSGFAGDGSLVIVISGGARGVDTLGEQWAAAHDAPVIRYRPEWKRLGKGAGFIRNAEMVKQCDAAVIVWDGKSRGTANTVSLIAKARKPYHERIVTVDASRGQPDSTGGAE